MAHFEMNQASCACVHFTEQPAQPYASLPSNAGPAWGALPSSIITGYLFCHCKAFDTYTRAQLQEVLQNLKINMEDLPPFKTITDDTGYVSHGVVKINNVSGNSSTEKLDKERDRGRRSRPLPRFAQTSRS